MSKLPASDEYEGMELLLLANMREQAPKLRELLEQVGAHWGYEDGVYRFYHQSFKVFMLQDSTRQIVAALTEISPERRPFCDYFAGVIAAGTGCEFNVEDNQHWVERTAPIVQAFLHAKYFLEMAVKYAAELTEPPQMMPSGWAAMLCLYGLR